MPTDANVAESDGSRANLALGLGVAALAAWLVAMAIAGDDDENGWIWVVMAILGLAALVAGLRAGPGRPTGRALVGATIGGLLVALFLGFVIADALS